MGRDWLTGVGDQAELFRLLWDTGARWGALATIDVAGPGVSDSANTTGAVEPESDAITL